jgi:Glycosyl hydrolases family 11
MKNFTKSVLFLGSVASLAVAVYAAVNGTYYGNAVGNDGATFYTIYSNDTNSSSIKIDDNRYRAATITWDNKNLDSADMVAGTGVGFNGQKMPTNVSYNIKNWTITRGSDSNNGVFGVYGWSCAGRDGIKKSNGTAENNVEFYVIDRWLGTSQYVPYDGSFQMTAKETVRANGADYKLYQSSTYNRANACGTGQNFHQVWLVRQGKKIVGTSGTNIDMRTLGGAISRYGYITANLAYVVVGVDAFKNTKGTIQMGYVDMAF